MPPRLNERIRMLDIELSRPLGDIAGIDGYERARALLRLHGTPVGMVDLPVRAGVLAAADIRAAVLDVAPDALHAAGPARADVAPDARSLPTLTVAVCTRERPEDLAGCLRALERLDYPGVEILVVDNAPVSAATAAVCDEHPRVLRVVEPRPGLDWARNRAVLEATGEILAFTDDDARVEPDWARRITEPFLADARVMAVAGLVVPLELETRAQVLFEEYGGLSGGLKRMKIDPGPEWGVRGMWHYTLMAQHGSGANMAFRRRIFEIVGRFDPALDVGTPTNGGGDTELLLRVMAHGYAVVYEPRALVRHRHRRDEAGLRRQLAGWGSGSWAVLFRTAAAFPRSWWVLGLLGVRGLAHQGLRLARPGGVPRRLILSELGGAAAAPWRYLRARRDARAIERAHGAQIRERPS